MPTRSRVSAGLRFSNVSPVEDSTHSPSMKFLKTLVFVWLSVAGEASVSVAIISPYKCLNIDATGAGEGAARAGQKGSGERIWRPLVGYFQAVGECDRGDRAARGSPINPLRESERKITLDMLYSDVVNYNSSGQAKRRSY